MTLTRYFFKSSGPVPNLSGKHWAVMSALHLLGPVGACCADLQRLIAADCGGEEPRLATIYTLLLDLERRGLVTPIDAVLAGTGGRPRRLHKLTKAGAKALTLGETMAERLELALQSA